MHAETIDTQGHDDVCDGDVQPGVTGSATRSSESALVARQGRLVELCLYLRRDLCHTDRRVLEMRLVLVHGGWQGGWCWDEVAAHLSAAGHEVFAPTLLGLAEDETSRSGVTMSAMAADLLRRIEAKQWERFALVGHSGGGPLVQLVAEGLPERVTATVFVDAWVLLDGETINDVLPDDLVAAVTEMAKASPDNTVPMPVDLWRTAFMQDGSEDLQRAVEPRLVPTPFGWFDEPVELRRFGSSGIPSGYVFLEQDQAVPPDIYQAAAARLNSPRIATSPGSHEAMLTRPRELAQALLSVLV